MADVICLPCGAMCEEPASEHWKNEISCTLVGCKGCKNFNGTEYYQANIPKGISMWAQHELGNLENGK